MATFLLFDGDRNFRETVAIALRLDGHEATATASLDEARAALRAGAIDCCVVDAHLAGADALLDAAAEAPVLVLATGRYPEVLAAVASRHARAGTLAKPFRAAELVARVERGAATAA